VWPTQQDYAFFELQGRNRSADFDAEFAERTRDHDYFLVTLFGELDQQPLLKQVLSEFPLAIDGDGYLLFRLEPEGTG
jgi:hypothetical protein